MNYLVTGGYGFIGSNLAMEVLRRGFHLTVLDNLSRHGSNLNARWVQSAGPHTFIQGDVRSREAVERAVQDAKPDVVFHLAGQVAMTTSVQNPRLDFETNVLGGFNVVEAVRQHAPQAAVIYSSTNKVYGDLEQIRYAQTPTRYVAEGFEGGFDECLPLNFQSPYGCSKGATDQYMLDYSRMFGLRTIVFRHSSVFGGRQFSTFDQGWVGWFLAKALEAKAGTATEPFTISGSGKQVRDVLFVSDLVECYFAAIACPAARGLAFNIGGGAANSLSLLELFAFLEAELGVTLQYQKLAPRQSDQKVFIADIGRAQRTFGWSPRVSKEAGLREMIRWVQNNG